MSEWMKKTGTTRRRTQAERSEETREKLCVATLDALIESGYGNFSTEEVARRANVSRGALTHQFPTRNALIIAAFEYLNHSWEESWPFSETSGEPSMDIAQLTDVLWDKLFHTGRYIASLEMMLAARIDDDLGKGIREALLRWATKRDAVIARILGMPEDDPRTRIFVQLNLCVMRGIAVHKSFDSEPGIDEKLLSEWKHLLLDLQRYDQLPGGNLNSTRDKTARA